MAKPLSVPRSRGPGFLGQTKTDDLYGLTKYIDESIGELFANHIGIKTICLRMAAFGGPKSLRDMGELLLQQRAVLRRDMVDAAVRAIEKIEQMALNFDVVLLRNKTDFVKEDLPLLRTNPEKVLERYYPGSVKLLEAYDIPVSKIYSLSDISKAGRVLGWTPTFSLRDFIENLKAGHYTNDHMFV